MFKRLILTAMAAFMGCLVAFSQTNEATVTWHIDSKDLGEGITELVFTGDIKDGWHTYNIVDAYYPTSIAFNPSEDYALEGGLAVLTEPHDIAGESGFDGMIVIAQKIRLNAPGAAVSGTVSWRSCTDEACATPEDWDFNVNVGERIEAAAAPAPTPAPDKSGAPIWPLILEAILWGFAMLLTPCVFPMVPMTISFFMKGSESKAQGRFKASMYGLFIVLLYTVPISLIILVTWLAGGSAVTADIFNWLATHWLPNLVFFVVFMIFAASFFGAFEIVLPSSLVNKSDKNSSRKGLVGIFFMALTLVLVSFSCTGPIVGTVLIKSTSGEFWAPMVTMLAFSMAFALPFTVLALFPSLLKNLPKSGGWLNSVKVVLGFIEIALGFKFLSVADQTYHWGILDREIYLAIWIVCFTLLGFYLLGKIRFRHDDPIEYVSVPRLALAIAVFTFVVYMIPGMWGAPLKALSGYMPPIETQDFVLGSGAPAAAPAPVPVADESEVSMLEMPHGLMGYDNLESALAAAKVSGKPVFVDITGHGCVNCREMEARVWSDPEVLSILRDKYVLVALYTDDKLKLPESKWITTAEGKVLKDVGRVNAHIVREKFGVSAQPNYALLSPEGELLAPVRGYDLSVPGFVEFLKTGLK